MKRLLLDIETSPHVAHIWGLWNQNIAPKQVLATGYTLCFSAKWVGGKQVFFDSVHKNGEKRMLERVWKLLDEADCTIHYNGTRFDIPTLNKEFLKHKLPPPSPYKQVDLLKTVRRQFRFHSNKLDEVLKFLGMEAKLCHKGHELWTECMAGDDKAWRIMEKYNRRDVTIMEGLYERLLPWIRSHPNFALYVDNDRPSCSKCGSEKISKQGTRTTATQIYQRYRCEDCFSWLSERTNCTPEKKKYIALKEAHD